VFILGVLIFITLVFSQNDLEQLGRVYIIGDEEIQGFSKVIRERDVYKFESETIDEGEYFLKLSKLNNVTKTAEFVITGTSEVITLKVGEGKNIDINFDKLEDILLRFDNYTNITEGRAEFFLKTLGNKPEPVVTNTEIQEEDPNYWLYIIIGVVVMVIVGVFVVLVILKTKKLKEKLEKPIAGKKPVKIQVIPSEHLEKARKLVKIARKKGYGDDDIREIFRKKRWEEWNIRKLFEEEKKDTVGRVEIKIGAPVRKPIGKPAAKPVAKPAPKPVAQAAAKPVVKPAAKPVAKPVKKLVTKPKTEKGISDAERQFLEKRPMQVIGKPIIEEPSEETEEPISEHPERQGMKPEHTQEKIQRPLIEEPPAEAPLIETEKPIEPEPPPSHEVFEAARSLVKEARKRGIPDRKIIQTFKKKGWEEKYINKILRG
jgi:hypothetical protein